MKRSAVLFASLVLVAGAYGCKTTSSADSGSTKEAPAKEAPAKSEKAVKQAPANIPASSPLAKVKMGCSGPRSTT